MLFCSACSETWYELYVMKYVFAELDVVNAEVPWISFDTALLLDISRRRKIRKY